MKITLLTIFFLTAFVSLIPSIKLGWRNGIFYGLMILLICVAGFRDEESVFDYVMYVDMFNNIDTESFVEPSFILISNIVHNILGGNVVFLFLIYAAIGISIKFIAIKQLSQLWFLSLIIYLGYFFILHDLTQIRSAIASSLLLLCIKPIYDRNLKLFLVFSLLACFFHYSALVTLPLWFIGSKKPMKVLLASLVPLGYLVYFSGINVITVMPIPYIREKIEIYQAWQELGINRFDEINIFNLLFLAKIAILYFLLWKYELLIDNNKYSVILMKIYAISLASFPFFASMPVVASRISDLFGIVDIVLIPFLFYVIKPPIISKTIIITIGLTMLYILTTYVGLID